MYSEQQEEERDRLTAGLAAPVRRPNTGWTALFCFTRKPHLLSLLPGIFLAAGAGILQPAVAVFFGKFFDAFSRYGGGVISGPQLLSRALIQVYALVGLGAATWILKGGYFTSWLVFGELQAQSVRNELFQSLLRKDLEWYETRTSGVGALLSRLQTQIRELQIATSQPMGFAVNYLVQCVAGLGLAFYSSWRLSFVTLAAIPICAVVLSFLSSRIQPNVLAQEAETIKASKLANNTISNITTIKCSNTQGYEYRRYVDAARKAAVFYIKQALANALQIGFSRFAAISLFVPGLWYGQHLVNVGSSTAGKVVTTFWACLVATKAFEDLLPHVLVLEKGRAAAISLREILDRVARGQELSKHTEGLFPEYCEGDIELRDISFAYPSRPDHLVLDTCKFFFPAGETSFVVGRSGSGKSTIANLLMRFYQPTAGTVLIDGDHIQDLSMSWIRNNITLIQQQSILFNETLLRNIAFGHRDHAHVAKEHVQASLELAALEDTIADMPEGLDTSVGMSGATLSGGQKQRVAIARARLRDTPILILDESTSALDQTSRTKVMANIRRWRQQKTTIVITHDLSQINDDDFVYILEKGKIVAEGYRSAVAANLENGALKHEFKSPQISTNSNFDFDWTSSALREDQLDDETSGLSGSLHSPRPRRDSIDTQLEDISKAESGNYVLSRQPSTRLSRVISRQFSGGTRMMVNSISRTPTVRGSRQFTHEQSTYRMSNITPSNQINAESQNSGTSRVRLGRPMSVHQAMVMRSIYRQPSQRERDLPHPAFFETPKLLRHMSIRIPRREHEAKRDVGAKKPALTIQKILTTVWPNLDRANRIFVVGGILATLIHAAQPPILAFLLVRLFRTFYIKKDQAKIALIYSMAALGVAVIDGIAAFLMHYLLERAAQTWTDNLRAQAMARILEQEKAWFDDPTNAASKIMSDLDRNADEMRNLVGRFAAFVVVVATMMVIGVVWSMAVCWKLTLVAIAVSPVMYFLTKAFEVISSRWESRTNTASEAVGACFVETFSEIRTLRAFTLESYFHKKYTTATSQAFSVGLKRAIYSGFFFGLSDSAINFIVALIFFVGAYLAKSKAYPVTPILTAFSLLLFCTANANSVVAYIPQISASADAAFRLLRLTQLPLRSHETEGRLKLDANDPKTLSGPVHFIHQTFSYPSLTPNLHPTPILQDLNLIIPASLCTALVGPSGSGKSTIASLLLGLYPPTADPNARTASDPASGPPSLTLSGRDIRSLHLPTLRSLIAYVPQTPLIFPASVRDNITYGLDLLSPFTDRESIEATARRAGIHGFVVSLPQGYDTLIGDGGLGLSGGQAQRIVIARALIRKPRVLILDEATSALDGEGAALVRESVRGLLAEARREREDASGSGRVLTVIVITHSREMMSFADNVIVLQGGQVVEEGGFRELMGRGRGGALFQLLMAEGSD